jgi:hypothetical protein
MSRTEPWSRLAAVVNLSLVLSVVPACTASAGHGLFRRPAGNAVAVAPPTQAAPYVAYRPAFPVPGTKPLFLNNYAGANYPSVAPGALLTPTDFRVLTGRPARPHRGWFGSGW